MPTRLFNLSIKRIAVVDDPDNPDAAIMMIKRRDEGQGQTNNMANDEIVLSEEQKQALVAEAVEKAKADAEQAAADELKKAQERIDELQKAVEEKKGLEGQLSEVKEQLKETREVVAKQLEERADAEAVEKMQSWDNIPGLTKDNEEVLKALKAVRKSCPGQADVLVGLIDTANTALGESKLLDTLGGDGDGASSAEAALNAKATEIQKAEKLEWPVAFNKACEQNPDLAKQYSREYLNTRDAKVRKEREVF